MYLADNDVLTVKLGEQKAVKRFAIGLRHILQCADAGLLAQFGC